jgi:hypothetical protein
VRLTREETPSLFRSDWLGISVATNRWKQSGMKPRPAGETMIKLWALVAGGVFASTVVAANQVDASTTKCQRTSGKRTAMRTVELTQTDAGGCRVYLTRDDSKPVEVAHADHKLSVCPEQRDRILENLKGSGFTCE